VDATPSSLVPIFVDFLEKTTTHRPRVATQGRGDRLPFVAAVPLKPRDPSGNWEVVEANLRRTIDSFRRSAGGMGAMVIACHEEPDLGRAAGDDLQLLRVPFARPADRWEGSRDKGRKRRFIGAWLRETLECPSTYVMFLDADDLVHERLVAHVLDGHSGSYVVDDGYVFAADTGLLVRRRQRFTEICGSSFVCRFERDELPRSWKDESALFSQFGVAPDQPGHSEYPRVADRAGRPPAPVPFPGVLYLVNHGESHWSHKMGRRRDVEASGDIVRPAIARRVVADNFAAPDLAAQVAGRAAVSRLILRRSSRRALARVARTVVPRRTCT